jgi:CRISPR-associated protein Cas2
MTRNDAHRYVIAYDVTDDRRRDRLAKCLERQGDRVQYSVFIVDACPARMERLKNEVSSIILAVQDSALFCDLGLTHNVDRGRFAFLGRSRQLMSNNSVVI